MKTGRNDPCPCGSGKKYKKCCATSSSRKLFPAVNINKLLQRGIELFQSNHLDQAKLAFNQILATNPQHADTLNYLGSIEASQGNIEIAEVLFRKAIAIKPRNAQYYNNLGYALELNQHYLEAIKALEQSLELNRNYSHAYLNLGNAYKGIGDTEKAYEHYQKSLQKQPDLFLACSNLLYLSNTMPDFTCEDIYNLHTKTISIFTEKNSQFITQYGNQTEPKRKLRIGYMSSDFREHSCSYFIEPVLKQQKREEFELFAYYNYTVNDETTVRIKSYFDVWRETAGHSDRVIANLIKADKIDILIDLSGYTAHSPVLVLTYKPAPIQISWIGYPNTTGIPTVDYRITDEYSDPSGVSEKFHTEQLLRMPDSFLVYKPPVDAPDVAEQPVKKNGYITFGSFNNNIKINKKVISLWAKIIKAVPDSKLLLKAAGFDEGEVRKRCLEQFASLDISEDRITLLGKEKTTREHLSLYHKIDIGLDTFPYNGTTTTFEALWMGVPVISLRGDSHRANVGTSILSNIKLCQWLAENESEYIQIAQDMASKIEQLDSLRRTMRVRMQESPLMNTVEFTKQFEKKLREVWESWCQTV